MNDRAVSTTVGYVIGLGIMTLLITGLFIAGGDFVNDQRQGAIRSELQVIGQQMSNDIARIDRMVDGADPSNVETISVSEQLPPEVAGSDYNVEVVTSASEPYLRLTTSGPDISVRVNVTARTALAASTIDGGSYRVVYDGTGTLEVVDA